MKSGCILDEDLMPLQERKGSDPSWAFVSRSWPVIALNARAYSVDFGPGVAFSW